MTIDRAELRRLCEEATPGPWHAINIGTKSEPMMSVKAARISGAPPKHEVAICATGDSPQEMENANAAFIAVARTALPALLDALNKAEAKHDSDHNLISSLQWQVETDRKIGAEWKQRAEARERRLREALNTAAHYMGNCGADIERDYPNVAAALAETAP